jgi:hypothetical protein
LEGGYAHPVAPPNLRFQPTASLAALASRRLKRGPLGGLPFNSQEDKNGQDNP